MVGELSIRAATRDDVPAVLRLWELADVRGRLPDTADALEGLIAQDAGALLLAEINDELVGSIIAAWDGWRGNMYRLAVLPEHRRQRIGARLVSAAHERLTRKGARRVTALVLRDEAPAAALWETAGYDRDALIDRFVRNL